MLPSSTDALLDWLERLRLLSTEQAGELARTSEGVSPVEMLGLLERRQLLTSYQVERIRKGEGEDLVIGDYKLMYKNASGSFARVYRVGSLRDGRMVGLKVLRERWSADKDVVSLFHREGEIGLKLKHPNIVPVYECGSSHRKHFIAMEFVEGGNLRDFLKIRGVLQPREACRFILDTARALEYALAQGYTHRDLKMTNVLMSSQGVAKLIDFGLAADDAVFAKVGGQEMQTALEYAALERGSGAPRNDPRSDLYFLGGIMFELLTGEPPYPRTRDRDERRRFNRYRDVRPVTAVNPRIPFQTAAVVDRLMQPNPAQRYASASELIADLLPLVDESSPQGGGGALSTAAGVTARDAGAPTESGLRHLPVVLCVENRPKHQDVLRDYLSRHGFRLLLLADIDRAIERIRTNPPDCVVLLGDVNGDRLPGDFVRMMELGRERRMSGVVVLAEEQSPLKPRLEAIGPQARVLVQPVTLRSLRNELDILLRRPSASSGVRGPA